MARPRLAEGRTTISCPSSSPASAGLASPKPSLSIEVTNNRLTRRGGPFRICCCERLSGGQSVKLCPQSGPLLGDEAESLGNLSQLGRGRASLDKGLQGIIIRQARDGVSRSAQPAAAFVFAFALGLALAFVFALVFLALVFFAG